MLAIPTFPVSRRHRFDGGGDMELNLSQPGRGGRQEGHIFCRLCLRDVVVVVFPKNARRFLAEKFPGLGAVVEMDAMMACERMPERVSQKSERGLFFPRPRE